MTLEWIQSLLAEFAYVGLVGILLAAGMGVPIPEDIPLMVGGLLSAQGVTNVYMVFACAYVAILVGDFIIFSTGRRLGPVALQKPWAAAVLTHERQGQLVEHFSRHGFLTIVVARHMAGLRAPAFLMAGVARMSPLKFLAADAFGACLSVPLFIWIGFKFGENLPAILETVKEYQRVAFVGAAVVVAAAVLGRRWWRTRKRQQPQPAAVAPAVPPPPDAAGRGMPG